MKVQCSLCDLALNFLNVVFDGQKQEDEKDGKKCGFKESITSGFAVFKVGRQRNVDTLARSKEKLKRELA